MTPPSSLPPASGHPPEPMTPPTPPSVPTRSASTCTAPSIHNGHTLMCSCVLQQVDSLSSVTFSDQSGLAHLCSSCLSMCELSPPGSGTTRVCVQIPFSVLTNVPFSEDASLLSSQIPQSWSCGLEEVTSSLSTSLYRVEDDPSVNTDRTYVRPQTLSA